MLWYILGTLVIVYFYRRLRAKHQYWAKHNVKQDDKPIFLLGDSTNMFLKRKPLPEIVETLYKRFENVRYSGMYQALTPTLLLHDPELIKQLTVKDFDHFMDHRAFIPEGADELWSKNLFALTGEKWRDMRATLSPSFTSSKMKDMFALISECAEHFVKYFDDMNQEVIEIEMKETTMRFANDVIATCAFGVQCDSLREKKNTFFLMGKEATDFTGFKKTIVFVTHMLVPTLAKLLNMGLFSEAVRTFFNSLVKDTIKMREDNNISRPDMIHLLMEAQKDRLKNDADVETSKEEGFVSLGKSESNKKDHVQASKGEISDIEITAQAMIFFFAGFETTSILMSFLAYELAVNPDIQERLINEIDDSLQENNGNISYDSINHMKYLDMVVSECLRKWPPPVVTDRVCVKPYTIPATSPSESPIHLNIGDVIWIPIYALHRDPTYYPDPDRFDPERFNEDNRANMNSYVYMPFGVGPRICIGTRFALMETKTLFVHILSKFKLVPVQKTVVPIRLSKRHFNLNSEDGFWLSLKKR